MASDEKWWNQYYVRYFVGTAFAVPMILILATQDPWNVNVELLTSKPWLTATVVLAAGLGYCYLASAPVLLMHSVRSIAWQRPSVVKIFTFGLVAATTCATIGVIFRGEIQDGMTAWLRVIPFVAVVGLQIFGLLAHVQDKSKSKSKDKDKDKDENEGLNRTVSLYVFLAKYRSESKGERNKYSEYIESYRHLREHGNAVSILVMELVLTYSLLVLGDSIVATGLIVFAWALPSTIAWVIGTYLEGSLDQIS